MVRRTECRPYHTDKCRHDKSNVCHRAEYSRGYQILQILIVGIIIHDPHLGYHLIIISGCHYALDRLISVSEQLIYQWELLVRADKPAPHISTVITP